MGRECRSPRPRREPPGAVDAGGLDVLDDGDDYHRVLWALKGRTLLAECDCRGYEFHGLLVEGDNYHKVVSVLEMVEKRELSKRKAQTASTPPDRRSTAPWTALICTDYERQMSATESPSTCVKSLSLVTTGSLY